MPTKYGCYKQKYRQRIYNNITISIYIVVKKPARTELKIKHL